MESAWRAPPDIDIPLLRVRIHRDVIDNIVKVVRWSRRNEPDEVPEVAEPEPDLALTIALADTLRRLSVVERACVQTIVTGETLREVGARLGFSESRACQIRRRALRRLRWELAWLA